MNKCTEILLEIFEKEKIYLNNIQERNALMRRAKAEYIPAILQVVKDAINEESSNDEDGREVIEYDGDDGDDYEVKDVSPRAKKSRT